MAEYIEREAAVMRLMQDGCSAKNVQSIMELPAASVSQWISVKDRLPECGVEVITFRCESGFSIESRNELGFYFDYDILDDVTHWMPLPEPPKGENDG